VTGQRSSRALAFRAMRREANKTETTLKSKGKNHIRVFLLGGVLAPLLMMLIIMILGQITPDYNPISDTVSRMGIPGKPYAVVLDGGYCFYGILTGLAAWGLYQSVNFPKLVRGLAILIGVHAMGTILLAVFPDSVDSFPRHITHDVVSMISYLPLLLGMLVTRQVARREKSLEALGILGLTVVAINLPMPVINLLEPLRPVSGLLQRLLSGGSFVWLTLTFLLLYRKRHCLWQESNNPSFSLRVGHVLQNNQTFPISKP
jgi:hypothetical membrane protein